MASANESTASALTFPAATWLKSNCNMNHHIVKIEQMSKITQHMPPASHHSIELHHCPDRMKFIFETYCCNLWLSILAFSWSPVCLWSCPCTCSSRFPFCRPCCCPCSLSVKNLNPPSNKHKQPIPHEPSLGFSSLPSSPDRLQVNIYIYIYGGGKNRSQPFPSPWFAAPGIDKTHMHVYCFVLFKNIFHFVVTCNFKQGWSRSEKLRCEHKKSINNMHQNTNTHAIQTQSLAFTWHAGTHKKGHWSL